MLSSDKAVSAFNPDLKSLPCLQKYSLTVFKHTQVSYPMNISTSSEYTSTNSHCLPQGERPDQDFCIGSPFPTSDPWTDTIRLPRSGLSGQEDVSSEIQIACPIDAATTVYATHHLLPATPPPTAYATKFQTTKVKTTPSEAKH